MRTSTRSRFAAALITGVAVLAGPAAYAGECDELGGSLYGLCVAFCEAQGCEATLHEETGEVTFDGSCAPSSPALLAKYEKRMTADDPHMPCMTVVPKIPPKECPCWTESEVSALANGRPQCYFLSRGNSTVLVVHAEPPDTCKSFYELALVTRGNTCQFDDYLAPGESDCDCAKPETCRHQRSMLISPEDNEICLASITAECDVRGIPLP